jgi:hypothetical protein
VVSVDDLVPTPVFGKAAIVPVAELQLRELD